MADGAEEQPGFLRRARDVERTRFSVRSDVRTFTGHPYDLVVSALSKCIRRQLTEEAVWCGDELVMTLCFSPTGGQEEKEYKIRRSNVMNRLMVAALEDNCPVAPWIFSHCASAARLLKEAFWGTAGACVPQPDEGRVSHSLLQIFFKSVIPNSFFLMK